MASSDRDTAVYIAKLAEQAERYDGKPFSLPTHVCILMYRFTLAETWILFLLVVNLVAC